jgi:hypothetical protein
MGSAIRIRIRKRSCGLAIAAASLAAAVPTQAAEPGSLDRESARQAARAVVLADTTYRVIDSSSPLRTRHCWRAAGRVVRCSLYRVAPTPCALRGKAPPDTICVQVLARRNWLVEVSPRAGARTPPAVKILKVFDGPG